MNCLTERLLPFRSEKLPLILLALVFFSRTLALFSLSFARKKRRRLGLWKLKIGRQHRPPNALLLQSSDLDVAPHRLKT
jgi:hypothetical protein